ncbi:MAG TPA: hypothetical protein DF613_11940 [Lachnospiraceae bacterium]|nr:hypothetical protein [Lachnospiraceae bacterium]
MKRRIVACILAFTILFADVMPVTAGSGSWQNSSFQKTIEWLFGHSSEIGYAEISAAAANMKQDYSLLEESFSDESLSAGLVRILDSYVRTRAKNSSVDGSLMDAAVENSHKKLWEYFQGNINPYGGSILKVQPMLQVRDVKEAEDEITLSVYEWVYMTYEINGRKDISGYGFDHQMVFKAKEDGWILVRDSWKTEDGENFIRKEPASSEDVSGNEDTDAPKDSADEADSDDINGGSTDADGTQKDDELPAGGEISGNDGAGGSQEDGKQGDSDGSGSQEDGSADDSEEKDGDSENQEGSGENKPLGDQDAADKDPGQESGSDADADKKPDNGSDQSEGSVSGEVTGSDVASDKDVPPNDDISADEPEAAEPAEDNAAVEEPAADSYINENPTEDTPDGQESASIFVDLIGRQAPETDGLFSPAQNTFTAFFRPLSNTFAVQAVNYTYSYQDAVAYADKYATSYNPAYENYNSIGGDCANFVSQCLYAGGLPMTDNWYFRRGADGKCTRTGSWSMADGLFNYVSQYCGTAVVNADPDKMVSSVTAGNPVFYYSSSKGRYSHAAICVGVNASGVPVIDAHNNDHLRAVWTLGTWSKRAVVKINGNGSTPSTQTPSLPPEEIGSGELWQITANSLNLREGAGTSYSVVGTVSKGKVICVVEKADVDGKTWGKTTYNGRTGWCSLAYASYVSGSMGDVQQATGISMDRSSATISGIGNTLKLNATVTPSGASPNLVWTSSNLSVATVEDGLVTALSDGTVVITAQTMDGSDKTASCIVSIADKPVTAITLNKTSISLKKAGSTATLTASCSPSSSSSPGVTWKSSNTGVVTVDSNGMLKAVKSGSARITATAKDGFGASVSCTVYVGRYTIKYNLNGGKNNSKNKSYYYSSNGRTLYTPTRSGYAFGGWYTNRKLTAKITKIAKGKTTNYTLYAKWVRLTKPAIKNMSRAGAGKVRVNIAKKIAGATGYEIQYAKDARFTKSVKAKKTTAISKTITGLKTGTRYYVRARAYTKVSSGKYVYSGYSGYRYITIP